jgi:hypothetical protein
MSANPEPIEMDVEPVELAQERTGPTALSTTNPESLMMLALEKGATIDVLERLMALRDKLRQEEAERAFMEAMASFQGDCPVIPKGRMVKDKYGKDRYAFAPMDAIVPVAQPHLLKHGLSYAFDAIDHPDKVEIILTVSHKSGHSRKFRQEMPIDDDAYMNIAQKRGSARSYAERYAFKGAFGIVCGGEDDDGNSAGRHPEERGAQRTKPVSQPRRASEAKAAQPAARQSAPPEDSLEGKPEAPANMPNWESGNWRQVMPLYAGLKETKTGKDRYMLKFKGKRDEVWASTFSESHGKALIAAYRDKRALWVELEAKGEHINVVNVWEGEQS